jgi:hypothetical protein
VHVARVGLDAEFLLIPFGGSVDLAGQITISSVVPQKPFLQPLSCGRSRLARHGSTSFPIMPRTLSCPFSRGRGVGVKKKAAQATRLQTSKGMVAALGAGLGCSHVC